MDVTYVIYGVIAVFVVFVAVAIVVAMRNRKAPGTGPDATRMQDVTQHRSGMDGM